MRPGATERLGLGPEDCLARNPRLVYGRMTGWGQNGPLALAAGHDLNYISLAGALHGLGQDADRPQFPTNLLGDFGGGSTYLVIGVLAALLESADQRPGAGRGRRDRGRHRAPVGDVRGHAGQRVRARSGAAANLLDGGAPFYDVYETADGRHMSVGAARAAVLRRPASTCSTSPDAPGPRRPRRSGRRCGRPSRRGSRSAPRPSGPSSSTAPTPASPRCCR